MSVYLKHTLSQLCAMLCLPCLLCATCLTFFTSLHLCTFANMSMHKSLFACVIKPNSYHLIWFTIVFDTRDLKLFLGILFDGMCVVHTLILWNYGHPIQTYICPPRTLPFV